MPRFRNRQEAGKKLADRLMHYAGRSDVLVLALPRGGVPVGYEVARALDVPLDILLVRKLGVPGRPELAMGAIASGNSRVINEDVVQLLGIDPRTIATVAAKEQKELERREKEYRGNRPPLEIAGHTVILVDDGLATGATMRAAVMAIRTMGPRSIIVAVPTAPPDTCAAFDSLVDETICITTPEPFVGVGLWYEEFTQTTDEEVRDLLDRATRLSPVD